MTGTSIEQLQAQLAALTERVATLEAQLAAVREGQEIPEEDLVAIGAAVAAYFGHKARVRAVRYQRQTTWAAAAREQVHDRRVLHTR
jgi:methylmalonyl-CoA carboxyltransferase 12S subunit